MKAISFLGFPRDGYQETVYRNPRGGEGVKTAFFQEALVEFYHPTTLYVLLTKTAETGVPKGATEPTWQTLQRRLAGKVDLKPILNVPEGHSPADVWLLFELLTGCLQERDRVLFDMTLGFRSLPVLALLAVSYLRVVRRVTIAGLIYGAFDAQDPTTKETPIFDLLPIISLLEWTTATDQFLKTGNGEALAGLVRHQDPALNALADNIDGIAQGLRLLRPMQVMEKAAALPACIATAVPSVAQFAPPFTTLLWRVQEDYGAFGLDNPTNYKDQATAKACLVRQLRLAEWYEQKGQIVQALSMAREWLPSLLSLYLGRDPQDQAHRKEAENLLKGGSITDAQGKVIRLAGLPSHLRGREMISLWSATLNLAELRNDVLHAGFRKNAKTPATIIAETRAILGELWILAAAWKLEAP